jgi:glycosyltransferase involved in cell wall biosynthesis
MLNEENRIVVFRNQLFKVSESFITNQAEALASFKPVYVGRKRFGNAPENSMFNSLEDQSLLVNIKYVVFRNVSAFQDQLQNHKPSLIHAHFGVEGVYAIKLANKLNIPVITTFHGFDATTTLSSLVLSGKPAWINYALYRKELIKKGALFICVSDFIRKKVIAMGFPEDRTVTHYIGIDVSKPPVPKEEMPYKVILHVARLTEKKGTEYLVTAFSKVVEQSKDSKLIIIGDGPLKQELLQLVNDLNLGQKIEFLGSQPNSVVMEWMSKADVFCLPSVTAKSGDSEGLGMVFLEAASAKVPIVATNHGGIPEAVVDGETGFLVEERNSVELAEKLLVLLDNRELSLQMGNNARVMIEKKFNLSIQSKKLEELYKSVLS